VNASCSDVITVPLFFSLPSPWSYNPRRPPPQYIWKSRWPPLTVRRALYLDESRKNKGTVNSLLLLACFPLFSLLTLYSFARFLRHVSLVQFIKQGFLGRTDTLLQSYFIKLPWENKVFSFTHSLTTFFPWSTTEQTHGNMDSFRFMQRTAEKKKNRQTCLAVPLDCTRLATLKRYFSSLPLNSFLFDQGLDDSLKVE